MTMSTARWALGGYAQQYPWPQCRYCGRAQEHDCPPATCLLCGSVQCRGNGSECGLCYYGWLPGWSHENRTCGYAGCGREAIADAPRVRRVCGACITRPKLHGGTILAAYVARRIELRDAGKLSIGSKVWRWVA